MFVILIFFVCGILGDFQWDDIDIYTVTANCPGAGSDSDIGVKIRLHGEEGVLTGFLDNVGDDFEQGKTNIFTVGANFWDSVENWYNNEYVSKRAPSMISICNCNSGDPWSGYIWHVGFGSDRNIEMRNFKMPPCGWSLSYQFGYRPCIHYEYVKEITSKNYDIKELGNTGEIWQEICGKTFVSPLAQKLGMETCMNTAPDCKKKVDMAGPVCSSKYQVCAGCESDEECPNLQRVQSQEKKNYCSFNPDFGWSKKDVFKCRNKHGFKQWCGRDGHCLSSYFCPTEFEYGEDNNRCLTKNGVGVWCGRDGHCKNGLFCANVFDYGDRSNTCLLKNKWGRWCGRDEHCEDYGVCVNSICKNRFGI